LAVTQVTVGCIVGSSIWIVALGTRPQLEVRKKFSRPQLLVCTATLPLS
jgi:hypothetical protein